MRAVHQPGDPALQTDHGRDTLYGLSLEGVDGGMLMSLTALRGTFDSVLASQGIHWLVMV